MFNMFSAILKLNYDKLNKFTNISRSKKNFEIIQSKTAKTPLVFKKKNILKI